MAFAFYLPSAPLTLAALAHVLGMLPLVARRGNVQGASNHRTERARSWVAIRRWCGQEGCGFARESGRKAQGRTIIAKLSYAS